MVILEMWQFPIKLAVGLTAEMHGEDIMMIPQLPHLTDSLKIQIQKQIQISSAIGLCLGATMNLVYALKRIQFNQFLQ